MTKAQVSLSCHFSQGRKSLLEIPYFELYSGSVILSHKSLFLYTD